MIPLRDKRPPAEAASRIAKSGRFGGAPSMAPRLFSSSLSRTHRPKDLANFAIFGLSGLVRLGNKE